MTLRHDNADRRLSPKGREIGLLGDDNWERFNSKRDRIALLTQTLETTRFKRSDVTYSTIAHILGCDLGDAVNLAQLSQRQNVDARMIYNLLPAEIVKSVRMVDLESALADLLYQGYIATQEISNERINHNDNLKVPLNLDFKLINGLSNEMSERLNRSRPQTFAQIRKIPGLTPAATATVLVYLNSAKARQSA